MNCAWDEVYFTARTGCVFRFSVVLKDSTGTALNLTGAGADLILKKDAASATIDLALTSGSGITITGASGKIDAEMSYTQTELLSGEYFMTLTYTESGGETVHIFSGKIDFKEALVP